MKKLTLSEWANVAEVLACVMVIVSLIYGISEYNRVRLIETSEIDDILYQSSEAAGLAIVSNDELAYLVYKAEETSENLTAYEKNRYTRLRFIFFNDWEKAFVYFEEGRMDQKTWEMWDNAFTIEVATIPDFFWKENRSYFPNTRFQQHVDAALVDVD